MVQRDQVPEEVVDIERWIQDRYTLGDANYVNKTGSPPSGSGIPPHIRTHTGGLQPDGDLTFEKNDGQAFLIEGQLNAGETVYSDWIDTDGWRTIEIVVLGDFQSAEDGVEVQFTQDANADAPSVDASVTRTYANEYVDRGFGSWDFGSLRTERSAHSCCTLARWEL